MKIIFLLTIIVAINCVSCTKDITNTVYVNNDTTIYRDTTIIDTTVGSAENSPYYMKATINGVNYNYGYTSAINSGPMLIYGAINGSVNPTDAITITVTYTPVDSMSNAPGIGFPTVTPIIPGKYTDTIGEGGAYDAYDASLTMTISGKEYENIPSLESPNGNGMPFNCTITQISDSTVSGTFSGSIYNTLNVYVGEPFQPVTNGSFNVHL